MRQARRVPEGGTIGVVATGSPLQLERFERGVEVLSRFGLKVKAPISPAEFYGKYDHGFTNGSAAARRDAFLQLLRDDSVDAIITARGGYGSLDIIDQIPFADFAASPKLLVGMSDVTALLVQTVGAAAVPSVHGPGVGTSFADYDTDASARESVDALISLLQDPSYRSRCSGQVLRAGEGQGRILAGNLTMLTTLLGTPFDVEYDGRLLILEEVGSAPFQVHRSLRQLTLAGKLERLAGIGFGRFSRCEAKHGPTVEEVLQQVVRELPGNYPVICNLPVGHWGENLPLPLGVQARIAGETLETVETPIQ